MEIEAKFVLPDTRTFRRLQAAGQLAGFALSAPETRKVRDTYLDTADRLMQHSGYLCRRREQNNDILLTVKPLHNSAGAVYRREELEISLPEDQPPARWPDGPVRARVLQMIDDKPLAPLFRAQQTRIVRLLARDERQVAELSLDRVRIVAGEEALVFLELECELLAQGTEEDLDSIVTCLQEEWRLQPQRRSKFVRALEFVDAVASAGRLLNPQERAVCLWISRQGNGYGHRARALLSVDAGASFSEAGSRSGLTTRRVKHWVTAFQQKGLAIFPPQICTAPQAPDDPERTPRAPARPRLDLDDSMAEAARKTLLFHFQRMLRHEKGTRAGTDPEELHDMRVATRRMRAALRVFDGHIDARALKPFGKMLRRTGRALGAVRDLDVFRDKARHYLDRLPASGQSELDPLLSAWQTEHDKAREDLLAFLDSDLYAGFKEHFGEFLHRPGAGALPIVSEKDEPRPHRVRHVLPGLLFQKLAQVRAYDEWLSGADAALTRYHQLRIACKRLRYTVEFFQGVLGPEAQSLIAVIRRLQDHLGNLQDAVIACHILRNFLTCGTWEQGQIHKKSLRARPIVAPGVTAYLLERQQEIQDLVATVPSVWSPMSSPDFNRQLAALVSSF